MKKIVLMGNPNVGKSVVFSRLTGAEVVSSNYPGTTVDLAKGVLRVGNEQAEVIDAPGTYSLQADNKAEEVAGRLLEEADLLINVADATTLMGLPSLIPRVLSFLWNPQPPANSKTRHWMPCGRLHSSIIIYHLLTYHYGMFPVASYLRVGDLNL